MRGGGEWTYRTRDRPGVGRGRTARRASQVVLFKGRGQARKPLGEGDWAVLGLEFVGFGGHSKGQFEKANGCPNPELKAEVQAEDRRLPLCPRETQHPRPLLPRSKQCKRGTDPSLHTCPIACTLT